MNNSLLQETFRSFRLFIKKNFGWFNKYRFILNFNL